MKVVLHVPHSSKYVPDCERPSLLLSDEELQLELLHMTDAYTDELFDFPETAVVRYPVSRLVLDPERFENDAEEAMASVGMGVIYTRTSNGKILREPPTAEQREALLSQYYRAHHQALTEAVDEALSTSGDCLIIDSHSFPRMPLPYELDQSLARPDICIGTDDFHTPCRLTDALGSHLADLGYTVAVNHPFSGALVPARFYRKDSRVRSVMVEVNRALYMDEDTGERSCRFDEVRHSLSKVLATLARLTGVAVI